MSSEASEQNSNSASSKSASGSTFTPSSKSSGATPARIVNNKSSYSSASWRSTEDIKRHFFKKDQEGNQREEEVKNALLKIGSTAENGSSQGVLTSRITKMVMAAAGKSPAYKPAPFPTKANVATPKTASPLSNSATSVAQDTPESSNTPTPRRKGAKLTFDQEIEKFLDGLEVENLDLAKMSFADLRHQLEKIKCRKLSKEEKKKFFAAAQKFVERITSPKPEKPNVASQSTAKKVASQSVARKETNNVASPSNARKVASPSVAKKESGNFASPSVVRKVQLNNISSPGSAGKATSPIVVKNGVRNSNDRNNKRKPSTGKEEPAAKKRQVERLDLTLAERLGTSPDNRRCLAAIKSPQSVKNCGSPDLKVSKIQSRISSLTVQKKTDFMDTRDTSPWEKTKTMPRLVTGKSFNVEPSSQRAAFEAMLEGEGGEPYCGTPNRTQKRSFTKNNNANATPVSAKGDVVPKTKKPTPLRTPKTQQAPQNVWLSKSLGEKIFSHSEPRENIERLTKAKSAVKTKKRKSMANEDMVPCPMCNKNFASSKIQLHAAACGILSSDDDDDEVTAVGASNSQKTPHRTEPSSSGAGGFIASESPSSYGFYLPSQSQDTPDMVECPICFEKFPNWRIEHHTNKCLAAG